MVERIESVKAATIGALSIAIAFFATTLINNFVKQYFSILDAKHVDIQDYRWWISATIASFSGFLFGVTYRYIIRTDNNLQLKVGGVMAFGLIRGLSQLEMGFSLTNDFLPFVALAAESILHFGLAAIVLDIAIQRGWVKPFK